jgi:hypothetical protein
LGTARPWLAGRMREVVADLTPVVAELKPVVLAIVISPVQVCDPQPRSVFRHAREGAGVGRASEGLPIRVQRPS